MAKKKMNPVVKVRYTKEGLKKKKKANKKLMKKSKQKARKSPFDFSDLDFSNKVIKLSTRTRLMEKKIGLGEKLLEEYDKPPSKRNKEKVKKMRAEYSNLEDTLRKISLQLYPSKGKKPSGKRTAQGIQIALPKIKKPRKSSRKKKK